MKLMVKKLNFCGCDGHSLVMFDTIRALVLISYIESEEDTSSTFFQSQRDEHQSMRDENKKLGVSLEQLEFTIGKYFFFFH